MKFPKMNPKVKRAWVKALRSGKYKQGNGQLMGPTDDGSAVVHCCLGVLCEVRGRPFDGNRPEVPEATRRWARLSKRKVTIEEDDAPTVQEFLASRNDDDGWGFKRIATWIEKHL